MTYSECVIVALGTQTATRMRHIVVWDLPSSTILSTLSHKQQDFREKINQHETYIFIFSIFFSETFLILRTQRDMINNLYWSSCKILVITVHFN
jgi:hypothetical protein